VAAAPVSGHAGWSGKKERRELIAHGGLGCLPRSVRPNGAAGQASITTIC